MLTLLHLLSAIALLVWGTHIVRTGILRVYGTQLRRLLSHSMRRTPLAFLAGIGAIVDAARRLKRNGRPIVDDPVTRQKLGRVWADLEVERYGALRTLTMLERGEHPGAGGSITKLSYSEFEKRFMELAEEILGPYGQLTDGVPAEYRLEVDTAIGDHGTWAYAFLWSRAGTIYAGSSEIQKNVIGERILGLPKEARADRVGGAR